MREPRATPTRPTIEETPAVRAPRAFEQQAVTETPDVFEASADTLADSGVTPEPPRRSPLWSRLLWGAGGLLVSLGLGLAAERLIRDLFARYEWLGWVGLAALAVFVLALVVLVIRELAAVLRLRSLDTLREEAQQAAEDDALEAAQLVAARLLALYDGRPDLARARESFGIDSTGILDGRQLIELAEQRLMDPLDRKARALTAASARRVALVTAISPRALIDIAYVVFESVRLARNLAELYGARPGALGFFRLVRSILAHLAVTGGLVLTDGVVEQLVGQSMASRLSARLGEGLVNGLMTVRVGIAAIRVVRPLPFIVRPAPKVADFVGELARVAKDAADGQAK